MRGQAGAGRASCDGARRCSAADRRPGGLRRSPLHPAYTAVYMPGWGKHMQRGREGEGSRDSEVCGAGSNPPLPASECACVGGVGGTRACIPASLAPYPGDLAACVEQKGRKSGAFELQALLGGGEGGNNGELEKNDQRGENCVTAVAGRSTKELVGE